MTITENTIARSSTISDRDRLVATVKKLGCITECQIDTDGLGESELIEAAFKQACCAKKLVDSQ